MSWSASAVGNPKPVAEMISVHLSAHQCSEPEETIKAIAANAISVALAAFPPDHPVRVEAHGSQTQKGDEPAEAYVNSLKIEITPLWGFLK